MNIIEAKMSRYGVVNLRNDDAPLTDILNTTLSDIMSPTTATTGTTISMLDEEVDEFSR